MELLKELCEAHGAPGFEDNIRAIFRREIEPFVDRIEVDGIGNCIAVKEGKPGSPKVMLAGHLDDPFSWVRLGEAHAEERALAEHAVTVHSLSRRAVVDHEDRVQQFAIRENTTA